MTTAFDWAKYENQPATANFDWAKYETEPIEKGKSVASALVKGLLKGGQTLNPLMPPGPISVEGGMRVANELLPSRNEQAEQVAQRAGELAPLVALGPEGLTAKAAQLLGGTLAGHIAEKNEAGSLGQAIAEGVGMGLPGLISAAGKGIVSRLASKPEKLPSGLTKPAALEAKYPTKAIISPERQQEAIGKLNKEAAGLTKGVIEKRLPLSKKIQEGHNFEEHFEKEFGQLRKVANNAGPEIDTAPLSEFFAQTSEKYKNIPTLHPDAAKVMKEISGFRRNPQNEMGNLLKIYRSNGQKIKNIYETSRITGRQQEYVDFLTDMNRSIVKSFESSLPADSIWLKKFKDLNAEYREYKNATKTLDILDSVLGEKATPASLEKLASNKKLQSKLALSIGEEGTKEIATIASDLKSAIASLKEIPAKELKAWDTLAPLSIFIPHTFGLGGIFTLKKGVELARRGYGYHLSTASRRRKYDDVLRAMIAKDKDAYVKAAKNLEDESD